jgi:hypothetical protein
MKSLIREYIKQKVRRLLEDREYNFQKLSPACYNALTNPEGLNLSPDYVEDVKILKATRPIFKIFLENGETFNLIDNGDFVQADMSRILFDLNDPRDLNAAKSELEHTLNKGQIKPEEEPTTGGEEEFEEPTPLSPETPEETAPEEPEA